MIIFDSPSIVLAIIGMLGLLSTASVVVYSFKSNKSAHGDFL